jgi:hypothetical protein
MSAAGPLVPASGACYLSRGEQEALLATLGLDPTPEGIRTAGIVAVMLRTGRPCAAIAALTPPARDGAGRTAPGGTR